MLGKRLIKFGSSELKSLIVAKHLMTDHNVEVVDRRKRFSFDDSFNFHGKSFDCGYHAIDIGRSEVYNDILLSLDIDWVKSPSTRSLVFNSKKYKRGYDFKELGEDFSREVKNKFSSEFSTKLERVYGSEFVSYALENISQSYTQNCIWKEKRLSDKVVLTNIYPWFFPLTSEDVDGGLNDIRPHFHNHMVEENMVMYPKVGSFQSITEFLRGSLRNNMSRPSDGDYRFAELDDNGIMSVEPNTLHILPIDYFDIAARFNLEFLDYVDTSFYLVSVVFGNAISFDTHEILVGDKEYYIDRVSSPDTLSSRPDITSLQFECEGFSDINEEELLNNIRKFTDNFITNAQWVDCDVKRVKIKRFNVEGIDRKIQKVINFVESKNPQVVVLNRHVNFEILSNGVENLINKITEKVK